MITEQELRAPTRSRHRGLILTAALLLIAVGLLVFYLFRLKRHAEGIQQTRSVPRVVAPPVSGPSVAIPVLVAYDNQGTLRRSSVEVRLPAERSQRDLQILHSLFDIYSKTDSPHALPPGADVKTVFLVGDDLAVIDLNSIVADQHQSGILVEELTLASVADTLAANDPAIKRVKFLVEGKERDTLAGHADLRGYYNVSDLSAFVATGESASH